ncbi:hypothetical protein NKG05_08120 [Oerskovia sp. M15]
MRGSPREHARRRAARRGARRLVGGAPAGDTELRAALRDSGRVLGSDALADLTRHARAELYGAGPLQPLLDDPEVTDVLVNSPADVWVDRGAGLERAPVHLGSAARSERSPSGSPRPEGSGSTTPARSWTHACPTEPACTPRSRPCARQGP